jgi:hypothetical protein
MRVLWVPFLLLSNAAVRSGLPHRERLDVRDGELVNSLLVFCGGVLLGRPVDIDDVDYQPQVVQHDE